MADNAEQEQEQEQEQLQQQTEVSEENSAEMDQSVKEESQEGGGEAMEANTGGEENGAGEKANEVEKVQNDDDADSDDDEDERKLFVGGLSWETDESGLSEYLKQFGEIDSCTIKIDQQTKKSRCFGFVVFKEVAGLEKALEARPHKVDDRKIDSKKAVPQKREGKLFVGGVKPETEDETIRNYFSQFGKILKIDRPKDPVTKKYKAFCFITFKKDGAVTKITKQQYHQLDEKDVECKFADSPPGERGGGGRGRGGRGGRGGYGNQGFGGGFGYGGGPFPGGPFGGFPGYGGPWGGGAGFNPYGGGGGYGGGGYGGMGFGGGYSGGYGYGQSGYGKSGRGGGRHQNNFKPY